MKIYDRVEEYVETPDDVGEYKMPEAYDMVENVNQEKRFSVAMQRYKDPEAKDKMNPFAEHEAWEEHQIGNATYLKQTPTSFSMISLSVTYGLSLYILEETDMEEHYVLVPGKSKLRFGSKDKKPSSDEYQYVFEDTIDFVKSSVIEGTQPEDDSDKEDIEAKDILKRELQVSVVTGHRTCSPYVMCSLFFCCDRSIEHCLLFLAAAYIPERFMLISSLLTILLF